MGSDLEYEFEKWHKSQSRRHKYEEKIPQLHTCITVGASRASQMHPCPYQGSVQGFNGPKLGGTQGIVMGMNGKAYGSPVASIKGLHCGFPSIPLP